jgi:phage terminase small subunit
MTERTLSHLERAFVDAYYGEARGNGAEACRIAGYEGNPKTLSTQADRLLKRPHVQEALNKRRAVVAAADRLVSAEAAAAEARVKAEGILSAVECAVILSGIATGQVQEPAPEGGSEPPKVRDRIAAIKALADLQGYDAPKSMDVDVTGALGVELALTPEQDAALEQWLLYRRDPVIAARIAELEAAHAG